MVRCISDRADLARSSLRANSLMFPGLGNSKDEWSLRPTVPLPEVTHGRGSRVSEEAVVSPVVSNPQDADLSSCRWAARHRVQGPPPSGQLQAKQVGQITKPFRHLLPTNPVAQKGLMPKPLRVVLVLEALRHKEYERVLGYG